MRVLLVDANELRATQLATFLSEQHLEILRARDSDEAAELIASESFAAIMIDSTDVSKTVALVREIRQLGHGTPIIVHSPNMSDEQTVELLDAGADDVLNHEVTEREMGARVRSMLRRCEPTESSVLKYEGMSLDLVAHRVERDGQVIALTTREIMLLEHFLRHRERVVTREEIADQVWGRELGVDSNVIEVYMARLRRKIDRGFKLELFHTIIGRGYMLSVTEPGKP
ncbi:MAG TPA: response regulator transcription factor [Tepidisphaeraceae bacterium]|nr:response regulator transcription factor [Tepidisphaeraceae bacterium]